MDQPAFDDATPNWIGLTGVTPASALREFAKHGAIARLSLTDGPIMTARIAAGFKALKSVDWLWLWRTTTRAAMRDIIAIPDLRVLDVFTLSRGGRLPSFAGCASLQVTRINWEMTADDVLAITDCASLQELGAQSARLNMRAIDALARHAVLERLNLESTNLDDDMAERLSASTSLHSLDIGGTPITCRGLAAIAGMKQLRELDLWATRLDIEALELLTGLPQLEYLSIGGTHDDRSLPSGPLLHMLQQLPALKRVWLTDIALNPAQVDALNARYEHVRIDID